MIIKMKYKFKLIFQHTALTLAFQLNSTNSDLSTNYILSTKIAEMKKT